MPRIIKQDSLIVSSWIIGLGINAVDDAGSEFENIFNVSDNWNIVPYPSRLSIGRYFKGGFGIEAIGAYNTYQEGKTVDSSPVVEDIDYFSADLRFSYDLNQILGETGWFDPYVGIGAGYTDANNQARGTYNASLGFRTWLSDRWGLDFNSTGKWTMDSNTSTNHLQHAAGVVYRFNIEKDLSRKGKEKQATIEEMKREQQRVQDSIDEAQQAENEARRLAEELEKQKEAERLATEEKARLEAERSKRNAIEDEIKALGLVYFDLNSSYLGKTDKALLEKLTVILKNNPDLKIKVSSHTDSRGADNYNLWLSERRVKRTADYLESLGVDGSRIELEAFGESQLTNECRNSVPCPEEKHRANRRCEFTVKFQ